MNHTIIPSLALCLLSVVPVSAQLPEACRVYPTPQVVEIKGSLFAAPKAWNINADTSAMDAGILNILKQRASKKARFTVSLKCVESPALNAADGAYRLTVTSTGAAIEARNTTGLFYGAQTFTQLVRNNQLVPCIINDWPDVPFRGTVEGFYGAPWKHEARLSQIRFYGKWKMNAYIYGPKDDPYSGFGSNKWRDEYPAENAKKLTELVKAAKENHVHFIWALHPGSTIKWHDKNNDGMPDDIIVAQQKFEAMYKLGIRAFAVFFDDIGGEGAKADMQVKMLNYINENFIKKNPDISIFMMCPTQYAGTGNSEYINTLGTKLDQDIRIMWTGPGICSDIPAGPTARITELIRRPPFIWWNWPVSDYCRKALLIGRTYGPDKANKGRYSGFVSNPMDKPEASKIPLFGIADYTWNIDAFDSVKSWEDSFPRLYPTLAKEMQLLANHNSDQTKGNGHGYHREESVAFLPTINAAKKEYAADGKFSAETQKALLAEFTRISEAGKALIKNLPKTDAELYYEIEYWVKTFALLSSVGTSTVAMTNAKTTPEKIKGAEKAIQTFARINAIYKDQQKRAIFDLEQAGVGGTHWAQGCEVGGQALSPFITDTFNMEWKKLYASIAGEGATENAKPLYANVTNIPALERLQPERNGGIVVLKKHEPFNIAPNQFIGIELPDGLYGKYIHVNLDNPRASECGIIETSQDGKTWTKCNTRNNGKELQTSLDMKNKIRFFRYKNTSDTAITVKLRQFKFDIPNDAEVNSPLAAYDGNPHTYYTVTKREKIAAPRKGVRKAFVISSNPSAVKTLPGGIVEIRPSSEEPVNIYEIIWK